MQRCRVVPTRCFLVREQLLVYLKINLLLTDVFALTFMLIYVTIARHKKTARELAINLVVTECSASLHQGYFFINSGG